MQQISSFWTGLDRRRQAILVGLAVASFAIILSVARFASAPGMSLLYAGLEDAAAGEVIQALEARGIRYTVRGDAIHVPAAQRDETRLMLAAAGLPANSHVGYELLDSLSGFGTTSQMFDAAYWRAKEGELARTIAASPHVRAARVHISQGSGSAFRREITPTAAVTVTTGGAALNAAQARAIRFLVASAVAGMSPEDVSVIDGAGGLVYGPDTDTAPQAVAADREAQMRRRVERLLEAHVGHGRAIVELSVDTVTDREVIHERRLDPESRIAISTETEESESSSQDSRNQGVTVASNLPDGDAAATDGSLQSTDSQTRQRTNFDMSETRREVERMPGAIRRLSVAVLIDGVHEPAGDGTMTWRPRNAEELEALRELVASAVGFDAARGDVITLRSLPFEPVAALGTSAPQGFLSNANLDLMTLLRWVFGLLAFAILALFVLRPLLRAALQPPASSTYPLLEEDLARPSPYRAALPDMMARDRGAGVDAEGARAAALEEDGPAQPDPVARLREMIAERQKESVELLRHWMDEPAARKGDD